MAAAAAPTPTPQDGKLVLAAMDVKKAEKKMFYPAIVDLEVKTLPSVRSCIKNPVYVMFFSGRGQCVSRRCVQPYSEDLLAKIPKGTKDKEDWKEAKRLADAYSVTGIRPPHCHVRVHSPSVDNPSTSGDGVTVQGKNGKQG